MIGRVVAVDDVATAFADLVVAERPRTLAVSGGGTARRCYEALADRGGVPWAATTVVIGDERWVPVDHDDSNEGMARAALLDHVPVGTVHSVRAAGDDARSAAAAYDRLLRRLGGVDLVHLGLGPDGHTASLFPGSPALDVTDRWVVAADPALAPWHRRVTMTFPAIGAARHAVVTVEGDGKREAWRRLVAGEDVPAARVRAGTVTWLVARTLVP